MKRFMVPFRMHHTGWFLLAFCAFIGIRLSGLRLGLAVGATLVVSLLLHEIGHMLTAFTLRVPVHEFGLCLRGAYVRRAYSGYRTSEILIAAAGPLTNLFLVIPFLHIPAIGTALALCNLMLGVVNFLPFPSSDGLHILRALWLPRTVSQAS